jgi:hypothetical protein
MCQFIEEFIEHPDYRLLKTTHGSPKIRPKFTHSKQISPKQINMGSDYSKLTFYRLGYVIVYLFE